MPNGQVIGRRKPRAWSKFVTERNANFISDEVLDLLDKLLRYDHQERLTSKEAMLHPYFNPVLLIGCYFE